MTLWRSPRRCEPGVTLKQIAEDLGIAEESLTSWLKQSVIEEGARPGQTRGEAVEVRELRRRNRLLEQENEVLRGRQRIWRKRA